VLTGRYLSNRYSIGGVVCRAAAGVVAVLSTFAFAVSLGAPAGAVAARNGPAFGPHDAGVRAHSSPVRANAVASLTLANIVVTDPSTNQSTVSSYANPAPAYQGDNPNGAPCGSDPNAYICMGFGSGSNNGGYFFIFGGAPYEAGNFYTDASASIGVNAQGSTCDINQPGYTAAAELDQYAATSTPFRVQTVAVQFDCTTASTDISGTIAYNIVPTDPSDGYYIFGQGARSSVSATTTTSRISMAPGTTT